MRLLYFEYIVIGLIALVEERRKNWKGFTSKYKHGLLKLYAQHATSAMKGAYMD